VKEKSVRVFLAEQKKVLSLLFINRQSKEGHGNVSILDTHALVSAVALMSSTKNCCTVRELTYGQHHSAFRGKLGVPYTCQVLTFSSYFISVLR